MIIDNYNKYNNNENIWNIVRIIKMQHRDIKWTNALGKKWCQETCSTQGWPEINLGQKKKTGTFEVK